jgi:chromosome segregation ATPase
MMKLSSIQTLENAATLDRFDALANSGFSPTLAVYRGRRFVIISEKATDCVAKICQLWNHLLYRLLMAFKLVSTDQAVVHDLQEDVFRYCYQRTSESLRAQLDNIHIDISDKEQRISGLQSTLTTLRDEIGHQTARKGQLEVEIQAAQERFASLTGAIAQANAAIEACQQADQVLQEFEQQKASLLAERTAMEREHRAYETKKRETECLGEEVGRRTQQIEGLTHEIARLQAHVTMLEASSEQVDYKQKYESLIRTNSQLAQDLHLLTLQYNICKNLRALERCREQISQSCMQRSSLPSTTSQRDPQQVV